jgi:hypothetical protein
MSYSVVLWNGDVLEGGGGGSRPGFTTIPFLLSLQRGADDVACWCVPVFFTTFLLSFCRGGDDDAVVAYDVQALKDKRGKYMKRPEAGTELEGKMPIGNYKSDDCITWYVPLLGVPAVTC